MSRSSCAFFYLAAATLFLPSGKSHAQEKPDSVHFLTPDGVKIKGWFYPAQAKCLATVIMLHPVGEGKSMNVPEWKKLAETLQKANYSVLMFDFRGHGDSTEITDEKAFWTARVGASYFPNAANVKAKAKDTIEVKDYIKQGKAYLPVLVNDIAAARAYLDRRNDNNKDCNTASLIVIGVDNGATLGALWMNAEMFRYKYTPNPVSPLKPGEFAKTPEGNDIIGAVFLSMAPSLEKRTVSVASLLKSSCKDKGTAALFFSGTEDKKYSENLANAVKLKGSNKHQWIGSYALDTNLTGMKLLTKGLKTEELIAKYLGDVVEDRKADWYDHEFEKSYYMWRLPSVAQPIQAKTKKGEKTLNFDDYNRFIPN